MIVVVVGEVKETKDKHFCYRGKGNTIFDILICSFYNIQQILCLMIGTSWEVRHPPEEDQYMQITSRKMAMQALFWDLFNRQTILSYDSFGIVDEKLKQIGVHCSTS